MTEHGIHNGMYSLLRVIRVLSLCNGASSLDLLLLYDVVLAVYFEWRLLRGQNHPPG
jgi:hypothetical protein